MLSSSKRTVQREGQAGSSQSQSAAGSRMELARFDGNRDPAPAPGPAQNMIAGISNNVRNIDLGAGMWSNARGARHAFQGRQPASTLGREAEVKLNAFEVTRFPTQPIYQYQVMVGTGAEKRGLIKAVWNSKQTKSHIGDGWIFDGNTLAWSLQKREGETRFNVNLDNEPGHRARSGRTDVHRVIVRLTAQVNMDILQSYLRGRCSYDPKILQSMTVLDHIMREEPSTRFVSIKRSYFAPNSARKSLGGHVDAATGVYQSLRIAHNSGGQHRLVVNADVANGTFWQSGDLAKAVVSVCRLRQEADIGGLLRSGNNKFHDLRRLRRLRVVAHHRSTPDEYVIDRFLAADSSHRLTFKDGTSQTVAQYFQATHNVRLRYPGWPVVSMTKKAILPLELLKLKENQRYTFKLDEMQTSQMIKVAVTPPEKRWSSIQGGVNMLDWSSNTFLNQYGMRISATPIVTKARILTNPKLQFGGPAGSSKSQVDPRTTGRWDLRGQKFISIPPPNQLTCWGICIMPSKYQLDPTIVHKFSAALVQAYIAHGATLPETFRKPVIHLSSSMDPAVAAQEAWAKTGNSFNARPQLLMFVLQDKNSITYGKLKRYCECRLGVVSQCVQWAHVQKAQGQYISNVLMKFNAKLGGFTNSTFGPKTQKGHFDPRTVIIGADVSHAAPGTSAASMAAMTVSMNSIATRYAAAVETNGHRVEMITDENVEKHIMSLIKNGWVPRVGQGQMPTTVIYFRDGVSEGQFAQVIDKEVAAMKKAFTKMNPVLPKFMVIVASKRHHVRFFPTAGDKNKNALPGTLVESGVTQPFENDFYLCSHVAIKGTARPVHYNVLLNEPNWPNERIQTMIYEHSYQYVRATTPVSLFPAVYYAHLASLRGGHHSKGFGVMGSPTGTVTGTNEQHSEPLMPMANPAGMNPSMWYI